MSDIKMTIAHCTCCLLPVERCLSGHPIATYDVDYPEEVTEDAD